MGRVTEAKATADMGDDADEQSLTVEDDASPVGSSRHKNAEKSVDCRALIEDGEGNSSGQHWSPSAETKTIRHRRSTQSAWSKSGGAYTRSTG